MQSDHSRQFTARLAELAAVSVFIEEYCLLPLALPAAEVALRLTFVVEELFTNSVLHGYGGERDAPIWVGLSGAGNMVELRYEDAAPPYDPLQRLQEGHAAPVASTVSGRQIRRPGGIPGRATGADGALRARGWAQPADGGDGGGGVRRNLLTEAGWVCSLVMQS